MTELSPFQKKCEEELARRLVPLGVHITDRKIIKGEPTSFAEAEIFIEASIDDFRIWIYDDSADVKSDAGTRCFEAPDYKTEDELITAFTDEVVSLVMERDGKEDK
jgi:hypothetical protein